MKTLTCKRIELAGPHGNDGWLDVFQQCGAVSPCDQDDKANFQKYKYAVGRNWDSIMQTVKACQKQLRKMLAPSDEYNKFMKEMEDLNFEYCMKDGNGAPELKKNEAGTPLYQFSPSDRVTRDGLAGELKKKYADAIDEQEEKESCAETDFMQGEVQVELFTVPWSFIPGRIGAAYYPALTRMTTDIPDDIQEMINVPVMKIEEEDA